jgi:hypothetical protein
VRLVEASKRHPRLTNGLLALLIIVVVGIWSLVLDQATRPRPYLSKTEILQKWSAQPGMTRGTRIAVKLMHLGDLRSFNLCCTEFDNPSSLVWVVALAVPFSGTMPNDTNWSIGVIFDRPGAGPVYFGKYMGGTDADHWPPGFDSLPDLSTPFSGLFYRSP